MQNKGRLSIRTRFAPSPTGHLHIGGARTALFNYLYARSQGGAMVLRIEDTDRERSLPEAELWIYDSLAWLGIQPDEGPEEGGPYGPYRQSERLALYQEYAQKLLHNSLAYPCFCSDEDLAAKQQEAKFLGKAYVYDGKCRSLSKEEVEERRSRGQPYAIRFRTKAKEIIVDDMIQGKVKFDARLIGDFIIVKSNGFPSYNYAVVLDDHAMAISHVIRGVGHLSNTPRQILLYEALALPRPSYAHISEIVGPDRKKLSKRQGAASILMFKELGYLPEAFANYMALLGWYPQDGREFLPPQELQERFDLKQCSKSPAMFDFFLLEKEKTSRQPHKTKNWKDLDWGLLQKGVNKKSKLNWLTNLYLRKMPLEELWPRLKSRIQAEPYLRQKDEKVLLYAFDNIRKYLVNLQESMPYLRELFSESKAALSQEAMDLMKRETSKQVSAAFLQALKAKQGSCQEAADYTQLMREIGQSCQVQGRSLYMPIRIAVTGAMEGLELPTLFSILGPQAIITRMEHILSFAIRGGSKTT